MTLIMQLTANSRLAYSELAEKMGLSVNAVHKRIQTLIEQGVICKFTAKVSLLGAGAIIVFVYGQSTAGTFQGLAEKIKSKTTAFIGWRWGAANSSTSALI